MALLVYTFVCTAAAAFVVGTVARAVRFARMPLHLRWELYPIPRAEALRAARGGSYRYNLAAELRFMIPEMLFLAGLRRANPRLWYRSFPFHFGLYLVAGSAGLVLLAALATVLAGGASGVAHWLALAGEVAGVAGFVLATGGACALLHWRLTDRSLRGYTTPGDVLNLLFFIAALSLVASGRALVPAGGPGFVGIAIGLLTWDTALPMTTPLALGLVVSAALVAYVPLTHMSHFVAKFFTYHSVRWDDRPLVDRPAMAARIAQQLAYRTTWSAPHVAADRGRTWRDVAGSNPAEGKR